MIRIRVEVGAGDDRITVEAESIERALEIARDRNPGEDCRVAFPIDPESFFVREDRAEVAA
jgi:hypothetical protein